jgi:hypothetical protein
MKPIDAAGLRRLAGGELPELATLRETSPDELARVATEIGDLVVPLEAVAAVLEARRTGAARAEDTWRWAKLLLHRTHPYVRRARGPEPNPIIAAIRELEPDFELRYEDGHDHAIAHVLGAIYRDRGDTRLEIDELLEQLHEPDPPPDLVETDGGLEIPALAGGEVTDTSLGHLVVATATGEFLVRIPDVHDLEDEGAVIERCFVRDSGTLELDFAGGRRVVVDPDDRYEAWEVAGRFGIICLPGGELAFLRDDPRSHHLSIDYEP